MLEFMLICNDPDLAAHAVAIGVDRIFIDLEMRGKQARQKGRNTVISSHTLDDIEAIRSRLNEAEILVRANPIHESSKKEINSILSRGTDVIMLPMFSNREEVERLIAYVDGRAKICLLVETAQALTRLPEILMLSDQLHEVYFGLNDLHISLGLDFMFECLAGGLIEHGIRQVKSYRLRTGFGGIGRIGTGAVLAEHILSEHVRLGSSIVILSRTFSDGDGPDFMATEIKKLREEEKRLRALELVEHQRNQALIQEEIWQVARTMRGSR